MLHNIQLVMSIFGNNHNMTNDFVGDQKIDDLLKMTNELMAKLKNSA